MEFKKKYAIFAAIVISVFAINLLSTLSLLFDIQYPEREIREVITDFFKNNLNKAVKFDDIHIGYNGDVQISNFNMSISSDFNDNVSLIKCKKAVIDLEFFSLLAGRVMINGLEFYNSEITFPKKYGRSHADSFYQVIDISKILKKAGESYKKLYIYFKRAALHYNESLKDKQVQVDLYKIDAEINIENHFASYRIDGYIKPYKTEGIRRGSVYCKGEFDLRKADVWSHRIKIDNLDLTYLNSYIAEYKLFDISLTGGWSCDLEFTMKDGAESVKGQVETNNLTVTDLIGKFNVVSNENLNIEIDSRRDAKLNRYTVHRLHLYDDVFSIKASGEYVQNEKDEALTFHYKTNEIDLSDLSQNITPYNHIGCSGTLASSVKFYLDIKKNKATGTAADLTIDNFSLVNNKKGNEKTLIEESRVKVKLTESEVVIDAVLNPLASDLGIKARTRVSSWFPFKSESLIATTSKKFNSEIFFHVVRFYIDKLMTAAYENKKIIDEAASFLNKPAAKFLNNNNIEFKCDFKSIFIGKKAKLRDFIFDMQLNRGALLLKEFAVHGCDAEYKMNAQAFFNTEQPYFKLEGKINGLDLADFFRGTGLKGNVSGKATIDYKYELSANRLSDILENSKGNLTVNVSGGSLENSLAQNNLSKFLRKNGYPSTSLRTINFETLSLSVTQLGDHFWFTNFGLKGDSLSFNGAGEYSYPAGLSSRFGITVRHEGAVTVVPVQLYGPLLKPCIDQYDKKGSQKFCF
jgi:hypothetical protein